MNNDDHNVLSYAAWMELGWSLHVITKKIITCIELYYNYTTELHFDVLAISATLFLPIAIIISRDLMWHQTRLVPST